MLAPAPKYLFLVFLCFIPPILYFRGDVSQRFQQSKTQIHNSQWANNVLHKHNASSFEHKGVFDETAEGAPRIIQVSMQFGGGFDPLYERGLRTFIDYGEKWGYPTHYLRNDIAGKGDIAVGVYDKLLYLLAVMIKEMTKPFGKRGGWIAWFDADAVLINHNIPWTTFLPPTEVLLSEINMLITKDWTGFNAGVFLIRVCEWSIHLLSDAIALPRLRPDVELDYREQDALKWVFNEERNRKHRLFVPRPWFNQYDDIHYAGRQEPAMRGNLLVHLPGMGGARPDVMGRWLDRLDRTPDEYRIALTNTSFPAEVSKYWASLKSAQGALKRAQEYKEEMMGMIYDITGKSETEISESLEEVQSELEDIIEEDAHDEDLLQQGVLKLDAAVQGTSKALHEAQRQEEEHGRAEEEAMLKEEANARQSEEEEDAEEEQEEDEEEDEGLEEEEFA